MAKNAKKPEFETPDLNKVKEAKKKCDRVSGLDLNWFSIEMGNNEVRILPPVKGVSPLFKEALYHYQMIQDDEGRDRSLLCRSTFGEDCPACEWVAELVESGDDDDSKKAGRIKAKTRYFFQLIDRQNEDHGVKIGMFPPSIAERIFSLIMDPNVAGVTDPDDGYDINIIKKKRKGAKSTGKPSFKDIEYEVNIIPDKCAVLLHEDDTADYSWTEQLANLDDVPRMYNYEDMKEMVESGELIPWGERSDAPDESDTKDKETKDTEDKETKDTEEPEDTGGDNEPEESGEAETGTELDPEDVTLVEEIRGMDKRKALIKYCGEWSELDELDADNYDSVEDLQTVMIGAFDLSEVEAEMNKDPESDPEPDPEPEPEEEKPKRSRRGKGKAKSEEKDEAPLEDKKTSRRRAAAKTEEPEDDKSGGKEDTSAAAKLKERSRSKGKGKSETKDKETGGGTRRRRRSKD